MQSQEYPIKIQKKKLFKQIHEKPITKHENEKNLFSLLPNVLSWKFNIATKSCKLVSSNCQYAKAIEYDYNTFIASIHKSTSNYYMHVFNAFISHINTLKPTLTYNNYCLQFFLPIYLEYDKLHYAIIYINPIQDNSPEIQNVYVSILALKEYSSEKIFYNVLKNYKLDNTIKPILHNNINSYAPIEKVLTKGQLEIFKYACQGYNSKEIAEKLETSRNNILKFNIRIKDRLSSFFDFEFDSIQAAVKFYKASFKLK